MDCLDKILIGFKLFVCCCSRTPGTVQACYSLAFSGMLHRISSCGPQWRLDVLQLPLYFSCWQAWHLNLIGIFAAVVALTIRNLQAPFSAGACNVASGHVSAGTVQCILDVARCSVSFPDGYRLSSPVCLEETCSTLSDCLAFESSRASSY